MENPKPLPLNNILLLISAVSLTLAGYFIYQTRELQKRLAAIESSQMPTTVEPTPPPAGGPIDETANWKTYANTKLGFELKYPPSVQIDKELNDQYNRATLFKGDNLNFEVMLRKNPGNITLDNYYYMDTQIKQKTTLAGNLANVYEMPNGYCDGPSCSEPSLTIVTENGLDLYHIEFYGDAKLSVVENQILSTFKFTDENSVEGSFCGGIAGIPCPSGYRCLLDGDYPDAGGKCQK